MSALCNLNYSHTQIISDLSIELSSSLIAVVDAKVGHILTSHLLKDITSLMSWALIKLATQLDIYFEKGSINQINDDDALTIELKSEKRKYN